MTETLNLTLKKKKPLFSCCVAAEESDDEMDVDMDFANPKEVVEEVPPVTEITTTTPLTVEDESSATLNDGKMDLLFVYGFLIPVGAYLYSVFAE